MAPLLARTLRANLVGDLERLERLLDGADR
jgi:hypothetical protein